MSLEQHRWAIDVVSAGAPDELPGRAGEPAGRVGRAVFVGAGPGELAGRAGELPGRASESPGHAGELAGAPSELPGRAGEPAWRVDEPAGRVGRAVFVGAGPGAPDLLTGRGARAIAQADVVIWASSLVDHGVLVHARPDAEIVDSAKLPMEGVLPYYQRAKQQKLTVARVHSGDPSLWGAIHEQLEQCHELGLETEVVPGVSSFTAVAATIQRELTIPEVAQSVILTRLGGGKTPMPPGERVKEFARHGTTMALFLSAARSGPLQDELLQGGYPPDTPCVVAYQVTWPDELIIQTVLQDLAATMKQHKLWKHTLVLVGPALAARGGRSHLYHPGHFHGYRKADRQARKQLRTQDGS
jgi:precorrin-4/cobalt-precorrin-4 C11-methyltransferase